LRVLRDFHQVWNDELMMAEASEFIVAKCGEVPDGTSVCASVNSQWHKFYSHCELLMILCFSAMCGQGHRTFQLYKLRAAFEDGIFLYAHSDLYNVLG
jgi:hypothetical protein